VLTPIDVPDSYVAKRYEVDGDNAAAWLAALPGLVAEFLDRWTLRLDGSGWHGYESLVLPDDLAALGILAELLARDRDRAHVPWPANALKDAFATFNAVKASFNA